MRVIGIINLIIGTHLNGKDLNKLLGIILYSGLMIKKFVGII